MVLILQAVIAAFLASLVEMVEALTIVLAVGATRGWRPAFAGAAAAFIVLSAAVLLLGPRIAGLESPVVRITIGVLLVLFGQRWLRKAILRAAGVMALHDEAKIYARETEELRKKAGGQGFDVAGAFTSFNGVFIEGVEVVIIVLTVANARGQYLPASLGAVAAAILVVIMGFAARAPLTRIPENALKMVVGVLLSSFGTLWVGEGLHLSWPGGDFSLIIIACVYAAVAAIGIALTRQTVVRGPEAA